MVRVPKHGVTEKAEESTIECPISPWMKSDAGFQMLPNRCYRRIVLQTPKGSHVPSFKNRKRAIKDSKTGKLRTLTEPSVKRWMEACIQSFASQLLSGEAIYGKETQTGVYQPSWIVSLLPASDSMNWLKELHVYVTECQTGEEGAEIIIEQIQ